jgi:hypothetical protein
MQIINTIPVVWVMSTSLAFNSMRPEGYGAFLDQKQQMQLERIRQARMLLDGDHRTYYLREGRTQFDFPKVRAGSSVKQRYLRYNLLGLCAIKSTDLLLGEQPRFKVSDPLQQKYLEALVERTNLRTLLYGKALDACAEAAAYIETVIFNGEVYLEGVDGNEIFPIGDLQPDGQYAGYNRFRVANVGTPDAPLNLLLQIKYSAGRIDRALWQLDNAGKPYLRLRMDQWPVPEGFPPLADTTFTGIDRNTITFIPNWVMRGQPVSDFDGALDLMDMVNAKQTQLADVIAKHASPKLAMHVDAADKQGNLRASDEVFWFRDKNEIGQYIELTNSQIENAMKDRDFAVASLLVMQEMSPVLLGLREGAHNDAYKKVRVQCITPLKKAERKAAYWSTGIKRLLGVAQQLENTLPGYHYNCLPIGVEFNDGIPTDELEEAQILAAKRGAGVISLKRSVDVQIPEPVAAAEELEEIKTENEATAKAQTPSVFLGTQMPGSGQGDQSIEAGEETAADAAVAESQREVAA